MIDLALKSRRGLSSYRQSIEKRKAAEAAHFHVLPAPDETELVRRVTELLLTGAPAGDLVPHIARLVRTDRAGVALALRLTDHERTSRRGTRHLPRAKGTSGVELGQQQRELYLRAAYVINSARRLNGLLDTRGPGEALKAERRFYVAHEKARRARQAAASAVNAMLEGLSGTKLGWWAHPDDLTTPECRAASGKNFDALKPPLIGYPGMLHGGACRCRPVPPFSGAGSVDQATRHFVVGG